METAASFEARYAPSSHPTTLKKGQIVFLDNVSTHKVDGVEEAIEARSARAVSCRLTARISILSNNSSQGSNHSYVK
jgi:hypothetical protein